MRKAKPIKVYEQLLTVKVLGVPFDMMRYDSACPATEDDAHKLNRILNCLDYPGDHVVRFRRYSKNGNPPNAERWKSFCCEVLEWRPTGDQ